MARGGGVVPGDYPPSVRPAAEFIAAPTDPEDERIEVGVVIVGGGPAGLACANLANTVRTAWSVAGSKADGRREAGRRRSVVADQE